MKTRLFKSRKNSSDSAVTPHQTVIKPRSFTVQSKPAAPVSETPDLQTQLNSAECFGHNFGNIPIFAPGTAPAPPIQTKGLISQPKHQYLGTTSPSLLQLARERRNAVSNTTLNQSSSTAVSSPQQPQPNQQGQTKFKDFDAKQYRVSGKAPNRKTEEVKRTEVEGKVTYFAMGLVVDFNGNKPVVEYYPEPVSLGNWYPSVTHINGMAVKPESGIKNAELLQEKVNEALAPAADGDGVALSQDAVDVLYTYSATLGALDPLDCIRGKLDSPLKRIHDSATEAQEKIMLDAVHNKHRTTVSAHSRGTIKTDNAVGSVYRQLVEEYSHDPELQQTLEAQIKGVPQKLAGKARKGAENICKEIAQKRAMEEMNNYIQLIYAGNAVLIPSQVLKGVSFVAHGTKVLSKNKDFVSILFGKHQRSTKNIELRQVKPQEMDDPNEIGGHSFGPHYTKVVGKEIAKDIKNNRQRQEEE